MSYNVLADVVSGMSVGYPHFYGVAYGAAESGVTQEHLDDARAYLDAVYCWPGVIADPGQPELWPRINACGTVLVSASSGRHLVDVPTEVRQAELVVADLIRQGEPMIPRTLPGATGGAGREIVEKTAKAGRVTTTTKWVAGTTTAGRYSRAGLPLVPIVDALLRHVAVPCADCSASYYFRRA